MSRGKEKTLVMKNKLGAGFDTIPVGIRRDEYFARLRGAHHPSYMKLIAKRGAAVANAKRKKRATPRRSVAPVIAAGAAAACALLILVAMAR